jgi:hypothetical protein
MSTRPVRTRKPPNRLTTGVVESRARKKGGKTGASKFIKKSKMVKKTIIKDQKTLISYIDKKIGNASGKNKLAWMTLRHIYDDYTDTGIKRKFKNLSNSNIDLSLRMQHELIFKPGSTLSDNDKLLPSTLKIEMNDEKMINLLVMVWLDMTHDETIPLNTSFQDFLKSDYVEFLIKTPVKYVKSTNTINKMIEYEILKIKDGKLYRFSTTQKSVSDSALKNNIHNIWNDGKGMHFFPSTTKIKSKIKQPTRPIYMSLDSEDSNLVELIKSSKIGNSYYIKPLINVANLLDPGRGGGSTGQRGGTMDRLTRQLFKTHPYTHYKFDVNTYTFNFGKYMTISIYINDTEFNISVNNVPLKMGTTSKKAKDGGIIEKISKFMGDFAQILTVSHQYKNGLRVVSGTIDGVFVGITAFLQKELLGLNPRVIIDNSTYGNKNGLIIHGFEDLLIKSNSIKQNPTVAEYIKRRNANPALNNNSRATTHINGMVESTKSVSKPGAKRSRSSNNPPSRNNTAGMNRTRSNGKSSSTSSQRKVSLANASSGIKGKPTPPVRNPVTQKRTPESVMRTASAKRSRSSNIQQNVPMAKRARGALSRNNTAGMNRPRSNVKSSSTSSQGKVSLPNASSGIKGERTSNSVTQKRTPESVMRTASAKTESITRTVSARQRLATSNSARSNQTRG